MSQARTASLYTQHLMVLEPEQERYSASLTISPTDLTLPEEVLKNVQAVLDTSPTARKLRGKCLKCLNLQFGDSRRMVLFALRIKLRFSVHDSWGVADYHVLTRFGSLSSHGGVVRSHRTSTLSEEYSGYR